MVRVVRRGNDDESNLRNRQQFFNSVNDVRVRIKLCCIMAAALQNRGKPQGRNGMNHRRMERAPGQPKSDESDVDHSERAAFEVRRRAYTNFPARRSYL